MQKILRGVLHPYRFMFGVLSTLFILAVLFPPVYVSQGGFSDVHLEWHLRFFAARLPTEQFDIFFLSLEVTALATLAAWLYQARSAWKPAFVTDSRAGDIHQPERLASIEHGKLLNRF